MKKYLLQWPLLALLFISQLALSQANLDQKIPVSKDVKIGKLPNGFTYYIRKNTKPENRVEFRLVVNTGSIMEDDDQLGLAHFMEHMNFNGSKHFPANELVHYLQSIGVEFGADLNAYTGFDETVYILPVPSDKPDELEKAFDVVEDWAGNALLQTSEIDKERGVVLEEWRSGKGADDRMLQKYFPRLFIGSKYAKRLPIGTEDNLRHFKPEVLKRFHDDWYRPDLEALVVVGDINVDEIEKKIKEHFSAFKDPADERTRPKIIPIEERKEPEAMVLSDKEAFQTRAYVFNYIRKSKEEYALKDYRRTLVEQLFESMLNQRLQELTQKPNPPFLAGFVGKQQFVRGYESFISGAILGGGSVSVALKAVATEVERARLYGFTQAELERAKQNLVRGYERMYNERDKTESSVLVEELINNYLEDEPIPGIEWEYNFTKAQVPAITLDEVNALKDEMEDSNQAKFILVTGPEKRDVPVPDGKELLAIVDDVKKQDLKPYEEKAIAASLLDKKPAAGKIVKEEKNEKAGFTKISYSNGTTVILKPTDFKNDEIVFSATRFGGRSLYGNEDKNNVNNLTQVIGSMGYGNFSPTDMQKFMSGKVARVQPVFGDITEGVSGSSSKKDFETALELMYLELTKPREDKELFTSFITKQKTFYQNLGNSPEIAFQDSILKTLFKNHPRASRVPTAADMDKVDMNRALAIYKERFGNASGMNFVFTGSFDVDQIKPLLATYIGGLPSQPRENKYKDLGIRYPKGIVNEDVYKGQEPKSSVAIFFTGDAKYSEAEKLKYEALVEIFQLMVIDKIREEIGNAYNPHVSGNMVKNPYSSYLLNISINCGPDSVKNVVNAVNAIVKELRSKGTTDEELNKVKETWKNQYDVAVKTNGYWAGKLASMFTVNYNIDDVLNYKSRVDALTTDDIKKAADTYLNPGNVVKVVLYPAK